MSREPLLAQDSVWSFPRLRSRGLALIAVLLGVLGTWSDSAVGLTLSGIAEGEKALLPSTMSKTNLTVWGVPGFGASQLVFTLEGNGNAALRLTSSAPFSVTFSNLSAGRYFLSAEALSGVADTSDVSFDILATALGPANDAMAMAHSITTIGQSMMGTNVLATLEPGEPQHAPNGGGRSIWWRWSATVDRVVTITTAGSSFDTVLAVYALTNAAHLDLAGANDDAGLSDPFSQVTFPAREGVTYFIAVDGALSMSGNAATGTAVVRVLDAVPLTIAIVAPTNGFTRVVASASVASEVASRATVSGSRAVAQVDYQLDGAGVTRSGTLSAPYSWALSQLPAGDYWLTVRVVDDAGLVASAYTGFSLVDGSAKFQFLERIASIPAAFQVGILGLKGMKYELQSAADLATWERLISWTNFDGAWRFRETNTTQDPARFYRVVAP